MNVIDKIKKSYIQIFSILLILGLTYCVLSATVNIFYYLDACVQIFKEKINFTITVQPIIYAIVLTIFIEGFSIYAGIKNNWISIIILILINLPVFVLRCICSSLYIGLTFSYGLGEDIQLQFIVIQMMLAVLIICCSCLTLSASCFAFGKRERS